MASAVWATAIIPELDRAAWFGIAEARLKILKGQAVFLDHLLETLGRTEGS